MTNLNDSGAGSLRSQIGNNACIVFDVGGTINLTSPLFLSANSMTIKGETAPSPGITITGAALVVDGNFHDIIVRNLKIYDTLLHDPEGDGIRIKNFAHDILIDRVAIDQGSSIVTDSCIDITNSSHDITVRYMLCHNAQRGSLINYTTYHISMHHNVFVGNQWRNPANSWVDTTTEATQVVSDVRDNIVWNWGNSGGGTILECGTHTNVLRNVYKCSDSGTLCTLARKNNHVVNDGCAGGTNPPKFFASGNMSYDSGTTNPDAGSTVGTQYTAPTYTTEEVNACRAAHATYALVGYRPLDSRETALLAQITLPACP